MTDFTDDFLYAFNHAMIYEVGGFWDPDDQDVIEGMFSTKEQRKKVGYVNIPADRGGETKYGIAQNANRDVVVRDLDLAGAMEVYYNQYYLRGKCEQVSYPLSILHFDGCVNHGVGRANKFLQKAVGTAEDGVIGARTIEAINNSDQATLIRTVADLRRNFYQAIVNRDPSQNVFLRGWLRRIDEVREYTLSKI